MGRKSKSGTEKRLEILSARVDVSLYKIVDAKAKKMDLTLAQVLRIAVREWLERNTEAKREKVAA